MVARVHNPTQILDLCYMGKADQLYWVNRLSLAEHLPSAELHAMTKVDLDRLIRSSIAQADQYLEGKAFADGTQRTRYDVDRYFGFDRPDPKAPVVEAEVEPEVEPEVVKPKRVRKPKLMVEPIAKKARAPRKSRAKVKA